MTCDVSTQPAPPAAWSSRNRGGRKQIGYLARPKAQKNNSGGHKQLTAKEQYRHTPANTQHAVPLFFHAFDRFSAVVPRSMMTIPDEGGFCGWKT